MLTVIVPIYNVVEYLSACLDSLVNQTYSDIEVVMVDDGSTDSSGKIAKSYAELYDNFKYYRKENGGLGSARNFGIKKAQGDYIAFVDSDDIIPNQAYQKMMNAALENDAEIVTGNVSRFNSKKAWQSSLHKEVFAVPKMRTSLAKTPILIYDTIACNKIYKKSFWERMDVEFPTGVLYEDIPITIPMYCSARTISMVDETVYLWRVREGASTSITQDRLDFKNMKDRLTALKRVDEFFLQTDISQEVKKAKDHKWLNLDLLIYINVCDRADSEYFSYLADYVNDYLEKADKEVVESLSVIKKMKYRAMKEYDQELLEKVLIYSKNDYRFSKFKKKNLLGDLHYYLKLPLELESRFSSEDLDITPNLHKEKPVCSINNISWSSNILEIGGYCFFPKIPLPLKHSSNLSACLINATGKRRIPLDVKRTKARGVRGKNEIITGINTSGKKQIAFFNYGGSGFNLTLNIGNLESLEDFEGDNYIELTMTQGSLKNVFLLFGRKKETKKDSFQDIHGFRLEPSFTSSGVFCLKSNKIHGYLGIDTIDETGISFSASLGATEDCEFNERIVPFPIAKNSLFFDFNRLENLNDEIEISFKDERIFFLDAGLVHHVNSKDKNYLIAIDRYGRKMNISPISVGAKLVRAHFTKENDFEIVINKPVKKKYSSDSSYTVELRQRETQQLIGEYVFKEFADQKILKTTITYGETLSFLPSGKYIFTLTEQIDKTKIAFPIYCDSSIEKCSMRDKSHKYTFIKSGKDKLLGISVSKKWGTIEKTTSRRKFIELFVYPLLRLLPINKNKIVFEGLWGRKYYCNPKALYEYINNNFPQKECIWSLNDERIQINGSGKTVRRMSLLYHYHMATAKYFVNNVNFHGSFKKRSGQIEIQTMHGMPLKTIGLDAPGEFKTQQQIDAFLKKCERWDYLVVQNEKVKSIVESCYRYKGRYLETGYPRNDILFSVSEDKIAEIKKKIGIPEDKKVILYAPTWRIENSFDFHFDIQQLLFELGDDYVFLLRVHPLASKGLDLDLIDNHFIFNVTSYSSTEELFLVSDLAITDYSSLMFDYSILEKPMIFYVYDLDDYKDNLRGLYFDFEKIAPGPLVKTQEEIVELLKDFESLKKDNLENIKSFKKEYCTYETGSASKQIAKIVFGLN